MKKTLIFLSLVLLSACSVKDSADQRNKDYLSTHKGKLFQVSHEVSPTDYQGLDLSMPLTEVTFYKVGEKGMEIGHAFYYTDPQTQKPTVYDPAGVDYPLELKVTQTSVPIQAIEGNDLIVFNGRLFERPEGKYGNFEMIGEIVADKETSRLNLAGLRNSTGDAINALFEKTGNNDDALADQDKVNEALKTERVSFSIYDSASALESDDVTFYKTLFSNTELKDYFE